MMRVRLTLREHDRLVKAAERAGVDISTFVREAAEARIIKLTIERMLRSRLLGIAAIIEAVDDRCLAVDGDVPRTRQEITDEEMRQIYRLAKDSQ